MDIVGEHTKKLIIEKALQLGFVKVGFAKVEELKVESERLKQWIDSGYAGDMDWIRRGFEKRKDVRAIMPEAKSVISLAYNYFAPFKHDETQPKISRYAWGKDYHKVLKSKLKEIVVSFSAMEDRKSGSKALYYVDDGPVMDKAWAVRAGIGWMGKHTNVINPDFGSWIFLCEIITNLQFELYDEPIEDLCGSCRICMDACPTGAIVDEYVLDSNRCISYQTIENRGDIPEDIDLHGWIFGCDVCQDVCPFNKNDRETADRNFFPTNRFGKSVESLNCLTREEFNTVFKDSAIKRTKFSGWKRNLARFTNYVHDSKPINP